MSDLRCKEARGNYRQISEQVSEKTSRLLSYKGLEDLEFHEDQFSTKVELKTNIQLNRDSALTIDAYIKLMQFQLKIAETDVNIFCE